MVNETELMSPPEVALFLRVAENTLAIWRSVKRYDLNYVLVGRKVFYRRRDVEKFLTSRTVSGVPRPRRSRSAA
jgi:hypothetical protein